jgi:hypothetical protein
MISSTCTGLTSVFSSLIVTCACLAYTTNSQGSDTAFYAEDIKEAMQKHLAVVTDDNGLLRITDSVEKQELTLRFLQIHDPVRQIGGNVYFACTDFQLSTELEKIYDIDFWLSPEEGALKVFQTRIHKEPRHSLLYGWYKHPRYTFVNDEIEYLYED